MSLCNLYLTLCNLYTTFILDVKTITMKTNFLFSNRYKNLGWFLFIPGIVLGLIFLIYQIDDIELFNVKVFAIADKEVFGRSTYFSIIEQNVIDELISVLIISGAILIAFSKEKFEDEFISKIRLESLVWATYVNYIILLITIIFVYDLSFFWVLVLNMFTILVFFLIRFNWALYKSKNLKIDEE